MLGSYSYICMGQMGGSESGLKCSGFGVGFFLLHIYCPTLFIRPFISLAPLALG